MHAADLSEPGAAIALAGMLAERGVDVDHLVHLGAPDLAELLVPGMRQRRRGGVLTVVPAAAQRDTLVAWSRERRRELAGTGVTAVCACPGAADAARADVDATAADRLAEFAAEAYAADRDVAAPGLWHRIRARFARGTRA